MEKIPVPKELKKELDYFLNMSKALHYNTGDTYARNFESWQLLKRYGPFLKDIKELRETSDKPILDPGNDWFGLGEETGNQYYSRWAKKNFPGMPQELVKIAQRYNSPEQLLQIAYYFLYRRDYITVGSPNNSYIYDISHSSKHVSAKVKVTNILQPKEIEQLKSRLWTDFDCALMYDTPVKIGEKASCLSHVYDKKTKVCIFYISNTLDDFNKRIFFDYCDEIGKISKRYFKNHKLSPSLFKNLLLLDKFENEYIYMSVRIGRYQYDPESNLGPKDIIMDIYEEYGDEINDKDLDKIWQNIRKTKERLRKYQEERFVT